MADLFQQSKSRKKTDYTAEDIEQQVPEVSYPVLDVVAKYKQELHVPQEVHPAAVKKDACEECEPRRKWSGG